VDAAGNRAFASHTVHIDKTPPVVAASRQPEANAAGWNDGAVTVEFSATDALSGLPGGGAATMVFANEGAGQSATRTFVDRAGNEAEATVAGINIDRTPPSIDFTGLDAGGAFTAGCAPTPGHRAGDALSGVAASDGVLSGGNANGVGEFTYTVTASDRAGNAATRSATFAVRYDFRGFFPPVPTDGSAVFRLGRTVPLKFQLATCHGSIVTHALARLRVTKLSDLVLGTGEPMDVESAGSANPDDRFRVSDLQYVYNLNTQTYAQGTYRFEAVLDDGTVHAVNAALKSR
jgi:hypothetical protein